MVIECSNAHDVCASFRHSYNSTARIKNLDTLPGTTSRFSQNAADKTKQENKTIMATDNDNENEMEHAMEEGNADVDTNKPAAKAAVNNNKTAIMAAVGAAVLVAVVLAVALPLGLRNKDKDSGSSTANVSNLPPDLNIGSGGSSSSSRSRSLPVISLDTLKETYSTCVDLKSDLEVAARLMADQTIESNIQSYFYQPDNVYFRGEGPILASPVVDFAAPVSVAAPLPPPQAQESSADFTSGRVTDGGGANIATSESSFGSNVSLVSGFLDIAWTNPLCCIR